MNSVIWNLYNKHRNASVYAICAVFGLCAAVALFWLVSGTLMASQTSSIRAATKLKAATLLVDQHSVLAPSGKAEPSGSTGYQAVEQIHAALVAEYGPVGCTINQFTSATTPGPYVSQYGVSAANFGSFHVRLMLTGNLAEILSGLHRLADNHVPIEYSAMSITPIEQQGKSESNLVDVNLEMDVLATAAAPPAKPGGAA